jgi:hypothetical protein
MSKSNYLEDEILDHVLGGGDYTRPATVYVSLHSADPGETGANELTGNGYARVAVTNNATNWPAASGGVKSNGTAITFAAAVTADWASATHFGIWDDDGSPAGNPLFLGALTTPKTVQVGDTASFAVGELDITES